MRMEALLWLANALLFVLGAAGLDLAGCGGFIMPSSNLGNQLDVEAVFSKLSLGLYTQEGILKEKIECAPNGYYFLPVYDKGEYMLSVEAPPGWRFEEKSVPVTVDDSGCMDGADINFILSGFAVSGRVTGHAGPGCPEGFTDIPTAPSGASGGRGGPAGVLVSISSSGPNAVSQTAITSDGGHFAFSDLGPGRYSVTASHPTWSLTPSELGVQVVDGAVQMDESFQVSGYDVRAKVVSSGEALPIAGVEFQLFSYDGTRGDGRGAVLAKVRSDGGGRAVITGVPQGCFILAPTFADETTHYEFFPTTARIEVGHGSLIIDRPFQVVGFTVYGRTLYESGRPVGGVTVLVNGEPLPALSDGEGLYKIEKMQSGTYDITAEKDGFTFRSLPGQAISATAADLPDIVATTCRVCGEVELASPEGAPQTRQIQVTNAGTGFRSVLPADAAGDPTAPHQFRFCYQLPIADSPYVLRPQLAAGERDSGVVIQPEERQVLNNAGPVDAVSFTQVLPLLRGTVGAITAGTARGHVVTARSAGRGKVLQATVGADGSFSFGSVFPGTYEVTIRGPGRTPTPWCWARGDAQTVTVGADWTGSVDFTQSGYAVGVGAPSAGFRLTLPASASGPGVTEGALDVPAGKPVQLCFADAGIHHIGVTGCVRTGREAIAFDTAVDAGTTVVLEPTETRLRGRVLLVGSDEADVEVEVRGADPEQTSVVAARRTEGGGAPNAVYEYEFWVPIGLRDLELRPRVSDPELLLFPVSKRHRIQTSLGRCQPRLPDFEARRGYFVDGVCRPPVAEVEVVLSDGSTGEEVGRTRTGADGTYRFGPLYHLSDVVITASKEMYLVEVDEENPGEHRQNFHVKELSTVVVDVVDLSPGGPQREALSTVLVSLSGHRGFRRNNGTDAAGRVRFTGLFPGTYFLRPVLKEYSFEPAQLSVAVGDGETHRIRVEATRTEFSAYGTVTSLNGQPLKGVTVEARSETESHYEETQTDAQGSFRLRGLRPGTVYSVVPKVGRDRGSLLDRAVPAARPVVVTEASARGVSFLGVPFLTQRTVSVRVDCDPAHTGSLQVEIWEHQHLVKRADVTETGRVDFAGLPPSRYELRLLSSLSKFQYRYETATQELQLHPESQDQVVVHLDFRPATIDEFESDGTYPFPLLLLLVGLGYLAVHHTWTLHAIRNPLSILFPKTARQGPDQSFLPPSLTRSSKSKKKK